MDDKHTSDVKVINVTFKPEVTNFQALINSNLGLFIPLQNLSAEELEVLRTCLAKISIPPLAVALAGTN